jgi:murein DD-endopeptidase MepM/ murein hydrolase activator NlpD
VAEEYTLTGMFKPFYKVYIGIPEAPDTLEDTDITPIVNSVSVTMSGSQNTGTAEVKFENTHNRYGQKATTNTFLSIHKSRVRIDIGYKDETDKEVMREVVFTGVSVQKQLHDSKNGGTFINVSCEDYSSLLRDIKITRTFEGSDFRSIIEEFARLVFPSDWRNVLKFNNSGLIPQSIESYIYSSGTESSLEAEQIAIWDFVVQLCDELGLATWFDRYGHWYVDVFGTNSLGVDVPTFIFKRGESLGDFDGFFSTPASVIGTVTMEAYKDDIQEQKTGSFSKPIENVVQNGTLTITNDKIINEDYATYLAKRRLAMEQSQYKNIQISNQYGIPYLQNGDFIRIQGEGVFDDIYWIRSITHDFSGGYRVTIKADQLPFVVGDAPPPIEMPKQILGDCDFELIFPVTGGEFHPEVAGNAFGMRVHPVYGNNNYVGNDGVVKQSGQLFHFGMDIDGPDGAIIVAAHSGTVTFAGYSGSHTPPQYTDFNQNPTGYYGTEGSGYGYMVKIQTDSCGKTIETLYAHMCCGDGAVGSSIFVKVGDVVSAGDKIGVIGNTGLSTMRHLHFGMYINGTAVDPAPYLES